MKLAGTTLLIWLLVVLTGPASGQTYQVGPRGGCYKISASGRKQYVDHSFCGKPAQPDAEKKAQPSVSPGKYMRGPRGGRYTITNGTKRYVDKSLCS